MERGWYCVLKGEAKAQGPVSVDAVVALAAAGQLDEESPVWTDGWAAWRQLQDVPELMEALQQGQKEDRAVKRQRLNNSASAPPPPEVQREIAGWAEALDEGSQLALFEKALFHHLEDAIQEQPGLRDQLLTTYVLRHPASDDRDPAGYDFTDEFLLDAIEDFESQEEMWEVLGHDNAATVRALISAAARLDQRYCAELQNLALLSRARALIRGGGDALADSLDQLLQQEPALGLARDQEGRTLWHDLAAGEHVELLRRLLPHASSDAAGGQAPGQHAAASGEGTQQRALNPVNLTDLNGNTPLHVAALTANTEVARLLIDAGAALDIQSRKGGYVTAGLLAGCLVQLRYTGNHSSSSLELRLSNLCESCTCLSARPARRDPSRYAQGSWQVRSRNLEFTVPVPSVHQTALHIAAEAGDLEMLQLLVARGAVLDLRDVSGSTPLHLALEAQDERAAAVLLQAGADPSLANSDMAEGASCLSLVAGMGRPGLLRLVLGSSKLASVAVNAAEAEQGFTPLMLAARRGNAECVQLLLDAGADPAAVNKQGRSASDIAHVNKRAAVVETLQRHAAGSRAAAHEVTCD